MNLKFALLGKEASKYTHGKPETFDSRAELIDYYQPTRSQWEEFEELITPVDVFEDGDFEEVVHG